MSLEFQQSFQPKRMSMPHGKGTHTAKRTTAKKKPLMMAGRMAKKKTGLMYGGMAKKKKKK